MIIKKIAAVVLGTMVLGACATKGYVRQQVETGVATERDARTSADAGLSTQITGLGTEINTVKGDVATLKTDVTTLRRDLTGLRDEFGAKITAMENGMKFAIPVTFAYDDATVRDEDRAALDRFTKIVSKYYNGAVLTVEGHADPKGTKTYNTALSKRRAESVAAYLAQSGLAGLEVRTVGYGEDRLVVKGAEADMPGAQTNRRVVFVIESSATGTAISSIQP